MSDKKLVMCGCHEAGLPLIKGLLESGMRFDHFVCLTPEQGEKANVSGYADFRPLAEQFNIPVYHPKAYSLKHEEDRAFFKTHQFDLLIQGGWQRLFPEDVLNTLSVGAIGGHGSADFLPKGRGRSPLNWSLIEGKKRFILQLFLMTPGTDDGHVFDHETFDINEFDDIRTLYYKIGIVNKRMHLRSVPKLLNGGLDMTPQTGEPSYYPKRSPEDGRIDWETMDVWEVYNHIRAQTRPYPGAFATLNDTCYSLWKAQVFDTRITYPEAHYGDVVETLDNQLLVQCRGGLLLITDYEKRAEPTS